MIISRFLDAIEDAARQAGLQYPRTSAVRNRGKLDVWTVHAWIDIADLSGGTNIVVAECDLYTEAEFRRLIDDEIIPQLAYSVAESN